MTFKSNGASQSQRIPSLDGLRAVAIFMVIALHLSQRFSLGNPKSTVGLVEFFALGLAGDGVGIFFVLSGFLITTLLLKEHDKTGAIDLGDFYLRRAFRILPPLYAYLLFAVAFCLLVHFPLKADTIVSSAFFYRNYSPVHGQWITEHTWSLSVEEQFYLLWPFTFVFVLAKWGRMSAAKLAAVLIAITPLLRIASHYIHLAIFEHRETLMLHTRMDALMCGCLLALLVGTPRFEKFFAKASKVWWVFPLEFLVLSGILYIRFGLFYRLTIGMTIDSIAVALFMLWAARNPGTWVGKILNSRLMVTAGVLSYSAYLWQTFFLHVQNPTAAKRMPWALLWIWIAAWLSYTLVEQPTLRLRKRIEERRKARTTVELA
jgi:peptidoglycan/LPS O-acetylase OafA/YrhL